MPGRDKERTTKIKQSKEEKEEERDPVLYREAVSGARTQGRFKGSENTHTIIQLKR
jgi:hypothetical protein